MWRPLYLPVRPLLARCIALATTDSTAGMLPLFSARHRILPGRKAAAVFQVTEDVPIEYQVSFANKVKANGYSGFPGTADAQSVKCIAGAFGQQ